MGGGGNGNSVQETADQREQMGINAKLWNFYQENYKPLIDKYKERVTDPAQQDAEAAKVSGKINASVMQSVSSGRVSDNPVANTKRLSSAADSLTNAQQVGQEKVKAKELGDTQNIINIGRGAATQASEGMGTLASQSLKTAISDEELQQQENAMYENAAGSVVGAAVAGSNYAKKKQLTDFNSIDWTGKF